MSKKTTVFRKGQKMEIGFDLKTNHTGKLGKSRKFTTREGEFLSNYMESNGNTLGTENPNN